MSIILFTGAGASAPFGYPTTNQFFSKEVFEALTQRGRKHALDRVRTILNKQAYGNEHDVEEVFLLVEPIIRLLDTPTGELLTNIQQDKWCEALSALLEELRKQCFASYGKPVDETEVWTLYKKWLDLFRWREARVSLFTTNYDRVPAYLQKLSLKEGLGFYDGFNTIGEWAKEGYGSNRNGLDVYYLHGSLSWHKDGERITRNFIFEPVAAGLDRHVLIYPGFKGNPEESSFPEPIQTAHRHLRKALFKAKHVVVIGFSFRDAALNVTFRKALLENGSLTLHIVARTVPDGAKELRDAAPDRFRHAAGHFEDDEPFRKISDLLQAPSS